MSKLTIMCKYWRQQSKGLAINEKHEKMQMKFWIYHSSQKRIIKTVSQESLNRKKIHISKKLNTCMR